MGENGGTKFISSKNRLPPGTSTVELKLLREEKNLSLACNIISSISPVQYLSENIDQRDLPHVCMLTNVIATISLQSTQQQSYVTNTANLYVFSEDNQ